MQAVQIDLSTLIHQAKLPFLFGLESKPFCGFIQNKKEYTSLVDPSKGLLTLPPSGKALFFSNNLTASFLHYE